jgi:serine/threonine-protein kinase
MLHSLRFNGNVADEAYGFDWSTGIIDYADNNDKPAPDWNKVLAQRPAPLVFAYRRSPYPITALGYHSDLLTPGVVTDDDPPPVMSGMINLHLDPQGRLLKLERVPEQVQESLASSQPIDWKPLFDAAGLDQSKFQVTDSKWTWLATSDARMAWTGTWPESGRPLRIEAASLRGSPVAFSLMSPWTKPSRMPPETEGRQLQWIYYVGLSLVIIIGATWLARRNLAQGRGDREGAWKLAVWIGVVMMALWVCDAHFNTSIGTFAMFLLALCTAVFYGAVFYVMYIALEPHLRRRWPRTLISWSAILNGQWGDPIVGRDVLVGVVCGLGIDLIAHLVESLTLPHGMLPHTSSADALWGFRGTLGLIFQNVQRGIRAVLLFYLILFLLRAVLRNQWLTAAAFAAILALEHVLASSHPFVDGPEDFIVYAIIAFVAWRFGLLAVTVLLFSLDLLQSVQATLRPGAWYAGDYFFIVAFLLAMAAWGCYTSMAGQKLWKTNLLET